MVDSSPNPGLTDADERVLRYLRSVRVDYPALVSGNTGLHVSLVERRIETLEADGYVEAVTGETIYRITPAGERALDGDDPATSESASAGKAVPDGGGAADGHSVNADYE